MLPLRRIQELLKMLNCSSTTQPVTNVEGTVAAIRTPDNVTRSLTSLRVPSRVTSTPPSVQRHTRVVAPTPVMQRRKASPQQHAAAGANTTGDREFISQGQVGSVARRVYSPSAAYNNALGTPQNKHRTRQLSTPRYSGSNKNNGVLLSKQQQEKAAKVLRTANRELVNTAPVKDSNRFSRYTPLPAIHSGGDHANENQQLIASPRLHFINEYNNHWPRGKFHKRNSIVANNNAKVEEYNVGSGSDRETSWRQEASESCRHQLIRQLTYKVLNPVYVKGPDWSPGTTQHKPKPKRSKTVVINRRTSRFSRDRLAVTKPLLDAAEKVKQGVALDEDTAFWVPI